MDAARQKIGLSTMRCPMLWDFLESPRPTGLGVPVQFRTLPGFLLVAKDMADCDKIAMAVGIYAIGRALTQSRSQPPARVSDRC